MVTIFDQVWTFNMSSCPNNCNGHGRCDFSQCVCEPPWPHAQTPGSLPRDCWSPWACSMQMPCQEANLSRFNVSMHVNTFFNTIIYAFSNEIRHRSCNFNEYDDLKFDLMTFSWPQVRGRLLLAEVSGYSLLLWLLNEGCPDAEALFVFDMSDSFIFTRFASSPRVHKVVKLHTVLRSQPSKNMQFGGIWILVTQEQFCLECSSRGKCVNSECICDPGSPGCTLKSLNIPLVISRFQMISVENQLATQVVLWRLLGALVREQLLVNYVCSAWSLRWGTLAIQIHSVKSLYFLFWRG